MSAFVAAAEETGATRPTGRGGDEGILETDSIGGEAIDIRSLDDGMPRTTESMIPLIVGEEKEDIGGRRRWSETGEAGRQEKEGAKANHGGLYGFP